MASMASMPRGGGGFSGGGGGGGFSGGGGGGFSGGGSSSGNSSGSGVAFLIFVAIFFLIFFGGGVLAWWRLRVMKKRRRARERKVELAAAEAADDDPDFAPDVVRPAAAELCKALYSAWSGGRRDLLAQRLGPDLMVEWGRRLDDFDRKGWSNQCLILREPEVEYLGLVNRADDADDRVVVRTTAWIKDFVRDRNGNTIMRKDSSSTTTRLSEYWTLGKLGDQWILLSIEQDMEGLHHLDAEIVASPWGDSRLRDQAVNELAAADAVADPGQYADLDFDGTARAAAMDLALVDGRFAPEVLEIAARRAVEAWAEAVDGADEPLERVATPEAVQELLYGGDASQRTRLVVRGPRLTALRITALQADATPPSMSVEADVTGRRYRENRDTAAVTDGSKERATSFTERWTMTLDGGGDSPWRIAATSLSAEPR